MNSQPADRSTFSLRGMFAPASRFSIWEKYGLAASRSGVPRRSMPHEGRYAALARPKRFCMALEEAGGLFARFGQFLAGRADLLPGEYIVPLGSIRLRRNDALSPSSVPQINGRVTKNKWLRTTACSEIYSATFENKSVVVEIFRAAEALVSQPELEGLERQLRLLKHSPEAPVASTRVLEQFREWLMLEGNVGRKRTMLRNLEDIPFQAVSRFPRLVLELQSEHCLGYEQAAGLPLPEALSNEKEALPALDSWAESWLEQPLLFSFLDADASLDNYLLLPDGGIGFRTVPALAPVPVEWHDELLQYLTAAVAGNSHRAMQRLSRICSGHSPYRTERMLLERLSALQPELRMHSLPPESIMALENYWRALGRTDLHPPLFLHLFHRNLTVLGQAPAGSSSAGNEASPRDVVSESLWPVLARLLQLRVGEILSTDKGPEWLAGSAMALVAAMRQVGVMMEHVRDNDLAFELESEPRGPREEKRNRRTASVIRCGVGLVLFLFSLEMAERTSGTLQIVDGLAAMAFAILVAILVARIE